MKSEPIEEMATAVQKVPSSGVQPSSGRIARNMDSPVSTVGTYVLKAVLKSKLTNFWYISKSTSDHKDIKFVGTLFYYIKSSGVFRFSTNTVVFFVKKDGKVGMVLLCFSI